MKIRGVLVLGAILLSAAGACAQDYAKVELNGGYAYIRFNPTYSNVVSGTSINGGGGGVAYYFNPIVGIEMQLSGGGATTKTFSFPAGSVPCPAGCNITASGNIFLYNFGPIVKPLRTQHFELFVEILTGGAHSNTYGNAIRACQSACVTSAAPNNNAWDLMTGGGFDIPINNSISIRPMQVDYVLTRFNNILTASHNTQSNLQYSGGIVLRFGR